MTKLQYMTEQAKEHICKADGANFDLWEAIGTLQDAVDEAEGPKHYARAFKEVGAAIEELIRIARELDVDSSLSRAARKDELDLMYKEAKHGML